MAHVELVLRVVYDRRRAYEYLTMDKKDLGKMIRLDFDALKLPHPPQGNIQKPTPDGIVVSWVTTLNTPLYETVKRVVNRQDSPATKAAKYKCWIKDLFLEELNSQATRNPRKAAPQRRRRSTPPSPPIVRRVRNLNKIDDVMHSLSKISNSLALGETKIKGVNGTPSRPLNVQNKITSTKISHPNPEKVISVDQRESTISRLTNELRAVRKQVAQDMDKAAHLEKRIDSLSSSELGEIDEGRDLDQLTMALMELSHERKKRQEAEQILADVQRECSHPIVVPEILNIIKNLGLSRVGGPLTSHDDRVQ